MPLQNENEESNGQGSFASIAKIGGGILVLGTIGAGVWYVISNKKNNRSKEKKTNFLKKLRKEPYKAVKKP